MMFRQKKYTPIGSRPDPIDSDKRFISKDFDKIYKNVPDLQTLKNELWSGINAGKIFNQISDQNLGKYYSNTGH
jgi:hypothetical protein